MLLRVSNQGPTIISPNPFRWRSWSTASRQYFGGRQSAPLTLPQIHTLSASSPLTWSKQLLTYQDQSRKLTTKESELLELLCRHRNEVLERNFALKSIWIDDNYFNARSMDVYITKLRKYLNRDEKVEILNIHGKGYKLLC